MLKFIMQINNKKKADSFGFSLIELLLTVAILAILLAIATPIYLNYVSGAKRSEAKANLQQLRMLLEQYYTENGKYCPETTATNCANKKYVYDESTNTDQITSWLPGFKPKAAASGNSLLYKYTIAIDSSDINKYTITATPLSGAPSGNLTIDQDGNKTGKW